MIAEVKWVFWAIIDFLRSRFTWVIIMLPQCSHHVLIIFIHMISSKPSPSWCTMNILSLGSALPALPCRAVWSATASWPPLESRTPNVASIGHLAGLSARSLMKPWSRRIRSVSVPVVMSSWKFRRHSWIYRILNVVLYVCIYFNRPSSMDINTYYIQ